MNYENLIFQWRGIIGFPIFKHKIFKNKTLKLNILNNKKKLNYAHLINKFYDTGGAKIIENYIGEETINNIYIIIKEYEKDLNKDQLP